MSYDLREARGKAAIVGAIDAVSSTGVLEGSTRALEVAMIRGALEDAGLTIGDVDGIFACTGGMMMHSMELAEYLGITQPCWTDTTQTGGSSFEVLVEHAAAAITLGHCEVAVIVYAMNPRGARKSGGGGGMGGMGAAMAMMGGESPQMEWEMPYGLRMPMGGYAMSADRHMSQYGTTSEQLAQIAVSTREWATMNPNARYQDPLTIQEVLDSPLQCGPLHKLDCCLVTDGAGALVMTSAERARDLKKPAAYVLGTGTSHTHSMPSAMPDLTVTAGAVSGPKAFRMAGVTPNDVDVLEMYDSFTITVLLALEDLGFVKKGEGGPFVAEGVLGPKGSRPAQTNGGGLSYTHPGMYGMFLLVEAVRQLRGECGPRQIENAEIAVAHGCGGVLSSTSTVVLGTESTL